MFIEQYTELNKPRRLFLFYFFSNTNQGDKYEENKLHLNREVELYNSLNAWKYCLLVYYRLRFSKRI